MLKSLTTLAIILSISACGGGGDSGPSGPSPEQIAAQEKAIKDAAQAIADNLPPAKVFTGAFTTINGVPNGYTAGTSAEDVVVGLARGVQQNQASFPEQYLALVSDAGLRIVVHGESIGTSSINGLPIYAADRVYVVKLTSSGLVVVQAG